MGELIAVHHLGLTVSDIERSSRWYCEVLGFHEVGRLGDADDERQKVFLRHDGLTVRLGLVHHRGRPRTRFDETRAGLDHLSFAVSDRSELDRWCKHLAAHDVRHSPIAQARSVPGALVVVFRDPDNIQLELFVDA